MSRWHLNTCSVPDVFTNEDSVPCCRACGESARRALGKAEGEQLGSSALPAVPFDESSDRLNLRWPPIVPFKKPERVAGLSTQTSDASTAQPAAENEDDSMSASVAEWSPIYGSTLGSNEFRLVCLKALGGQNQQSSRKFVHLSLETYEHDSCPEYETVSYTWAGEDGNGTLTRPVYVGPYWDILFATKNCWEMLQYLRPWRGIRMVWIDAVCINQYNTKERDEQVAKMGKIYTECSRAVLWLGYDVVQPSRTHASRHRLYDLESALIAPVDPSGAHENQPSLHLGHLLTRRYFKRVWVIQELILSRRVIIPIHNMVFWADSALMERWSVEGPKNWKWEDTGAPWVQNITRGEFPAGNAFELVARTSRSQASDARDRIFGVLGLLKDESTKGQLLPDYTRSRQQVFVGFFAYSMLVLSRLELLFHARCCSNNTSTLTWVPKWESQESWESIFHTQVEDRLAWEDFASWARGKTETVSQIPNSPGASPYIKLMKFTSKNTVTSLWTQGHEILPYEKHHPTVLESRPWNYDISVNSDTGALAITLTRLVTITSKARLVDKSGHLGLYEVPLDRSETRWRWRSNRYFNSPRSAIYLATRVELDTLIQPDSDEIFVLQPGKSKSLVYLILRKTSEERHFKLIACCANVCFGIATNTKLPTTIYPLEALQHDLYRDLKHVSRFLNSPIDKSIFYPFLEPELVKAQIFLPFFLDMAREQINQDIMPCPAPRPFAQLYLSLIDQAYSPSIQSGYVELQFEPELWDSRNIKILQNQTACRWEWTKDRKTWKSMQDFPNSRGILRRLPRPVILRCLVREIHDNFFSTMANEVLYQLEDLYRSGLIGLTDTEVEARLKAGPRPEERFVATPFHECKDFSLDRADIKQRYSEDAYLPNQLGVDGSTYQVHIL
ncbi:unnamed protein product [Clonostachys byssicola]|uniref:Heterokaryon incompatibility domain-containing protein n=1 Tax=Clonostachys byssicola TaxID=160290 RepID=A0A9N9UJ24_9HYPO|nr:unnamed protein product [Clonostachys byssicola]